MERTHLYRKLKDLGVDPRAAVRENGRAGLGFRDSGMENGDRAIGNPVHLSESWDPF